MRQRMASTEAVNTAVFEEAANDRFDADIFGQSGHTRPQAANAAHDQIDSNAGGRSIIKRIDNSWVDQRIHFHPDRRWSPRFGMSGFLQNMVENSLAQIDWRNRHALELTRLGIPGNVIEYA